MRKVFVEVKLVINANDDVEFSKVMDELDYNFTDTTGRADVEDSEILDYEVTDSK